MGDTLFFILSKAAGLSLLPEVWGLLLIALGLWRGRFWNSVALAYWASLALLPLGAWLIAPLEARAPASPRLGGLEAREKLSDIDGIIVLGGWEEQALSKHWGQLSTNASAERAIVTAALARLLPDRPVIVAGGRASLFDREARGQAVAREALGLLFGHPDRLFFETRSRTTAEHPAALAELIHAEGLLPPETGRWLIVTSAYHMPRALAVFCSAGWTAVAGWPTDYQSGVGPRETTFGQKSSQLGAAVREWVGLAGYLAGGRITRTCLTQQAR
ncbi:MAG: YdcF family protein [Pseudomonadota bacterium]